MPDDVSTLHADGRLRRTVGTARRYLAPYLALVRVADLIVIIVAIGIAQVSRSG